MRNLILFFIKYHAFFLFILLELICFALLIQNNNFHRSSFINSSNKAIGSIYETYNTLTEYLHLKKVNESFAEENAQLRSRLNKILLNNHTKTLSVVDSTLGQSYTYIAAKIISNSTNKVNNYLTLNRGKRHGIDKGMGVICAKGVVGIVKDVSNNYASVMSLLHSNIKISSKLSKSNYFGSIIWNLYDPHSASLKDIPKHVELKQGDPIVTSGYSSFFPENIPIGIIESFKQIEGSNFYNIKVSIATNFENLGYVYVVNALMKHEKQQLETQNEND